MNESITLFDLGGWIQAFLAWWDLSKLAILVSVGSLAVSWSARKIALKRLHLSIQEQNRALRMEARNILASSSTALAGFEKMIAKQSDAKKAKLRGQYLGDLNNTAHAVNVQHNKWLAAANQLQKDLSRIGGWFDKGNDAELEDILGELIKIKARIDALKSEIRSY